jgi:CheY-like chemotaxis protein
VNLKSADQHHIECTCTLIYHNILFLFQAASHSSIHFHSSAEHNGILLREENNTIEDNLLRQIANVESKDDANGSEALNQSINLVSVYSKQLENKGGSFSSAKIGKKVSISIIGSTIIEDLSSYSSRLANSRRQSLFTKQKLDILIVDDSGLSRKMLSRLLTTSGCVCDIAEDGLLALDKVKAKMSLITNGSEKGSFDVILMDFVMPNMDGPTATKAIRDRGYTAPIFGTHCIHIFTCVSKCIGIQICI